MRSRLHTPDQRLKNLQSNQKLIEKRHQAMNTNDPNQQSKPQVRDEIFNQANLSEPSLWNSPVGRRMFLKSAGAATVATMINLHGFTIEVLSSGSSYQVDQ
jgi:hypothetical protein